jgi:hypothetical protein
MFEQQRSSCLFLHKLEKLPTAIDSQESMAYKQTNKVWQPRRAARSKRPNTPCKPVLKHDAKQRNMMHG